MKKQKIPLRVSLFWDVDPKIIHPTKHATYIVERIMDFGNEKEVRWMWKNYPHPLLKKIAENSRVLHAKSRNLWKLLLK